MKRPLILTLALAVIAVVVALVGAAAPSGHARGISYASLNPVQRAHVSGALAAALGSSSVGAKPAGKIAEHAVSAAPACSTMDPGEEGDEGDDACPPGNFAPAGGGGGAAPELPAVWAGRVRRESRRRRERQGEPELPERLGSRPRRPRPGPERDRGGDRPEQQEPRGREPERLPPWRRQLLRRVFARRRQPLERHDDPDGIHARHRLRRWHCARVLAGGRRHVGRLGHEGQRVLQLPGVQPGRAASLRTRTSRARSTSSARPATTARRGTSRAGRSPSTTTPPARERRFSTSST